MKFLLSLLLIWELTPLDLHRINTRRNYYPPPLARFFQNKFTVRFTLMRNAIFSYIRPDAF